VGGGKLLDPPDFCSSSPPPFFTLIAGAPGDEGERTGEDVEIDNVDKLKPTFCRSAP
jgi:hypothetical protein